MLFLCLLLVTNISKIDRETADSSQIQFAWFIRILLTNSQFSPPSFITDPPGKAFLRIDAEEVVKGDAVTLTCDVGDPGRPEADRFVWMRGRHVVSHVHGRNWTVDPVTLQTKANISCVAVNAVGEGERDSVDVEVFGELERGREWFGTEPKVSIEISHSVANIGGYKFQSEIDLDREDCN